MRSTTPRVRFYDVDSADGTRLRAWTNDADGPTLLLCNGLGTNPYAWPALLDPGCGVRVISWNHRGVGGSDRPTDRSNVGMDSLVEDAVAVLDDAGVDACPVGGWSMGVNTAFELAARHPERVTGLFAVGGVPGNTFGTMLEPLRVPRPLRRALTVGAVHLARRTGRFITPVMQRLPMTPHTVLLLRHSGFMLPSARPADVAAAVKEFLTTDVDWYANLAIEASRHQRVPLSGIRVPTTFIAGTWDVLAGLSDMKGAAERIPGSRFVALRSSHFLPLERPDEIHAELLDLMHRIADAPAASAHGAVAPRASASRESPVSAPKPASEPRKRDSQRRKGVRTGGRG